MAGTTRGAPVRIAAEDIAAQYRQAIWAGQYRHGDVLPRANDVAEDLGADRKTVLDAYRQLADEGLVEVRRRVGTVVTHRTPMRRMGAERYARHLRARGVVAFMADREAAGEPYQRTDQTPMVRRVPATADVAAALLLPLGAMVIERARLVRDSSGRPTQSLTSWYRVDDVAGSPIETSSVGTAGSGGGYSTLDALGIGPTEITEEVLARMPTPDEAALLELPGAVPITDLTRYARHDDYLVEYARGLYVGPRFSWSYTFPVPD
jgi:GntR family transcriptional regulator